MYCGGISWRISNSLSCRYYFMFIRNEDVMLVNVMYNLVFEFIMGRKMWFNYF